MADGLFEKIRGNIFTIPEDRLDKLASGKGYADSFFYLLAMLLINTAGSILVSVLFGRGVSESIAIYIVAFAISIPMFYVGTGVLYVLLRLFGGKADYLRTVQVSVYADTCGFVFGFIPIVGLLAGLVSLYNSIMGFRRVHGLDLWKVVVAAVVIPALMLAALVLLASWLTLA